MVIIELEKRSILKTNYSHFITIPVFWLKHHNLGKGDLIKLKINESGHLVLIPSEVIENDS